MKDILKREIQVGQYIAYGLMAGRSANLAIYRVKEVTKDFVKGVKIIESYGINQLVAKKANGFSVPWRYMKFVAEHDSLGRYIEGSGKYIEMTDAEKTRVDNKTTTIKMSERAMILDGFTPKLLGEKG